MRAVLIQQVCLVPLDARRLAGSTGRIIEEPPDIARQLSNFTAFRARFTNHMHWSGKIIPRQLAGSSGIIIKEPPDTARCGIARGRGRMRRNPRIAGFNIVDRRLWQETRYRALACASVKESPGDPTSVCFLTSYPCLVNNYFSSCTIAIFLFFFSFFFSIAVA